MTAEIEAYLPKEFLARQGTEFSAVRKRLVDLSAALDNQLDALDDKTFYEPIGQDKWTPAEIADHIVRTHMLMIEAMEAVLQDKPLVVRPKGSLSAEGKPVAPETEMPVPRRARKDLKKELQTSSQTLLELASKVAEANKLEQTCLVHGFFGEITVLEALQLSAWHIRHHHKQLPLAD
ncbi:MAG: DinB family protein [Trueperaceae bacterium]|nr:DinB family protein [Trueperaceae bacterium]